MIVIQVHIKNNFVFALSKLCSETNSTYEKMPVDDEEFLTAYITCEEQHQEKIILEINSWGVVEEKVVKKEATKIQKLVAGIVLVGIIVGICYLIFK